MPESWKLKQGLILDINYPMSMVAV